ncbi:Lysophospholipase L1 [Tessaracoccus bendigoensis DSM 12906]|uniref:Lysophospholipase L1 n=1 Tax=Tessaracoccus bendigoensis DSM 12906 TaxID=1123357 RepID=A0A1M6GLQ8_9ACTN|nr:SGNH/GDSL hydrolase family protein [Tessaracoccus bendigoensis]SHJ10890.1 Lysophospholipase L1 [Tessaracoccus bendigoensis DSM 12906]
MKQFLGGFAAGSVAAWAGSVGYHYLKGHFLINRHVDAYREHWESRLGDAKDGVLHYVALGDSAAQGVGASHVGASYVAILGERLAEATGNHVAITNLSVSGAVSGDVVARQLPLLADLSFTPDVVTLDIGGNDVIFAADNTVDSFAHSFEKILAALPPGSFVGDVPWFLIPGLAKRSKAMARRAIELIDRYGHHLVPIYQSMRDTGYLRYYTNTAGDWFHPNDKGYLAWADLFWAELERSGKVGDLRESC